jgi:hypothetical protein
MGLFGDALGYVKNWYNGAKEVISSVYQPVKSVVNSLASGASTVNDWINKAKDVPLLRDIVSDVVSPIWDIGYSALRDVNDGVNYAGSIGSAIDQAVSGSLDAAGRLG